MILDTKLGPGFVLHAHCFFIAGNRPVLTLSSTNKTITHENHVPKS